MSWAPATSCWAGSTSHWASNATWLRRNTLFWLEKGRKDARDVVLEVIHVALDLQRDMAAAGNSLLAWEMAKRRPRRRVGRAPRRIGPPTRHGSAGNSILARKRAKRGPPRRVGGAPRRIGPPTRHG